MQMGGTLSILRMFYRYGRLVYLGTENDRSLLKSVKITASNVADAYITEGKYGSSSIKQTAQTGQRAIDFRNHSMLPLKIKLIEKTKKCIYWMTV